MPGRRCAVYGCNNSRVVTKAKDQFIIYHNFPKLSDMVSTTIKNEWIRRCKRADKWNPDTSQICSIHFTPADYERDLQNELLGLPLRKTLKKSAVPTLNLPNFKTVYQPEESARQQRLLKRKRKEEVAKITSSNAVNVQPSSSQSDECVQFVNTDTYEFKYNELLQKYNELDYKNKQLIESSNIKIKSLNSQLSYYKKKCLKTNIIEKQELNILKKFLTPNQIAILTKRKKRVNWTSEELAVAFTVRYYSKKAYLYLRNNLNYPLPGLSSLRRWASKINVSEGVLKDILTLLNLIGENLNEIEKQVVLIFDEVKIKSLLEYDVTNDKIIGLHNQMQVVMIRGLFSNWKQPVYIAFDQKMTMEILLNIISMLHHISYNVVACVSDCGGSNIGLWKELEIDKSYFKHPHTNNNVYMFADAPHLLKLLRNWLLDTGFQLENNVTITRKPLDYLIRLTDTEVNVCYKISEKHINCEKTKRQNVRLAAQLMSHTVGTALLRYKPGENKQEAENVGNFICNINKWFDIFNSYVKDGNVPTKSAYGVHLNEQKEHLNKICYMISTMRPLGKNNLQTFQRGMIMSIKSLQQLFDDMKSRFQIQYICTHKLNQDCLENFFFQIRSRGPNEHPSPLTAIHRIRMIILGKNPGILGARVNTVDEVVEEYMVVRVMEAASVSLPAVYVSHIDSNSSGNTSLSFSGSENSISEENSSEITYDALEYIAGYLAHQFKKKIPTLGSYTYKSETGHNYNLQSWVQQLSYGGLIKPTHDWLQKIIKWNNYFEIFHKDSYRREPAVVKKLALKILKRETMPFDIIKAFCKLRTIIRINYINAQNEYKKMKYQGKRKNIPSEIDSSRAKIRKLNKIIY